MIHMFFAGNYSIHFGSKQKQSKKKNVTWQNGLHVMVVGAVHVHTSWTCIKYIFVEQMLADVANSI